jgi:hypothetical protein
VALTTKTFTTQNAGKWIVIIMLELMIFQTAPVTERHITYITVIWSLICVRDFMFLPIFFNGKHFVTNITSKWTYFTMHALIMLFQITLMSQCLFTHITAIWTITTVHALKMLLQVTLITAGLITHKAREWTLSSM